jgi:hypothetical protein
MICIFCLSILLGASKQEAEECLPSAEKMFKSVTKAGFLDVKNKEDIDWDKMITSKSEELDVKCSNTHAMPPPKSYESQSPALKPTLGDTTVIKTSRKRHAGNDDDTEETAREYSCSSGEWACSNSYIKLHLFHMEILAQPSLDQASLDCIQLF